MLLLQLWPAQYGSNATFLLVSYYCWRYCVPTNSTEASPVSVRGPYGRNRCAGLGVFIDKKFYFE